MIELYILASVVIVSLISIVFAMPYFMKRKIPKSSLLFILSVSVGVLLSTVFIDFLPEITSHKYTLGLALSILLGFLVMFILEKFIHSQHKEMHVAHHGHGHAYHVAPMNVIGDAVHNFLDGLVIAGSYAVSIPLGLAATVSIIFHEIPQEIADFGVLLYSGWSKKKALFFNFLSAITAVFGAIVGMVLVGQMQGFTSFIIPFAAGNFIYIAASNLVPQLHHDCSLKDSILHVCGIVVGIAVIVVITLYGPAHGH
ncbi:ZIP family metal transporter [Candidatus Woesearchaeota archaeon]|nr:ZIP family metal transporter [Candidatus Woesearchaeota archaeon]